MITDRKEKVTAQISKALNTLGVNGTVRVKEIGADRYRIEVDGEYYGIFDTNLETFVD